MRAEPLPQRLVPGAIVLVVVAADALLVARSPGDLDRLLINAMLALSAWVTLHARLLSLANAGFMAIGAYASAILAAKAGLPVAVSVPLAIILCGLAALLIGLPVLRLKDVYLAICTLGFGEMVRVIIILIPALTGGPTGANLSTGFPYEVMHRTRSWMIAAALLVMVYLFWALSRSKTGRALRSLRENPQAASAMGVNVVGYANLAFLLSAVIAGAAGAFYAHSVGSLEASDFRFTRAVTILSFAVVGGSSQWFGALLGAGLLTALPLLLRDSLGSSSGFLGSFAQLPDILTGLALMLVIIFAPGGLAAAFRPPGYRAGRRVPAPVAAGAPAADGPVQGGGGRADGGLVLSGISRSFGGLDAVKQVSFEIQEGSIVGLIGPNGAGKTTLINMISGLDTPSSGRILWRGREINGRPAHAIARAGISRTFQNIQLFAEMSVLDNVIVGAHAHIGTSLLTTWLRLPRERRMERAARAESLALLERLGLAEISGRKAGTLSYGDQRRVEIARALAVRPRLLLLDEPAAGMNEAETARLGTLLRGLKEEGYTLLLVEHHMDLIMGICDRIIVVSFGRKIAEGAPAAVARDPLVVEAYLGKD